MLRKMLAFGRCWRLHIHGLFQPNKDSAAGGVYLPIIYHLKQGFSSSGSREIFPWVVECRTFTEFQ